MVNQLPSMGGLKQVSDKINAEFLVEKKSKLGVRFWRGRHYVHVCWSSSEWKMETISYLIKCLP